MSYLEQQAEKLSEITEKPKDDILGELNNFVKEGFSEPAAAMRWKSQHKRELGAGESRDFIGRVIGKGELREGTYGKYGYMGFLIYDDGVIETRTASFSSGSLAKRDLLQMGYAYEFKAYEKSDGALNRVKAIKEIDDSKVPKVQELVGMDFKFKPISELRKLVGESHLLHGWVGESFNARDGTLGFTFGDEDTVIPATVWVRVDGEVPEVTDGDELFVYGYVNINAKDDSVVVNANGVFKA